MKGSSVRGNASGRPAAFSPSPASPNASTGPSGAGMGLGSGPGLGSGSIGAASNREVKMYSSASVKEPGFAINEVRALVKASANYDLVSADEIAAKKTREEIVALQNEIMETIPDLGSEHPKTLGLYSRLGMIFSTAGYLAEAEGLITRAWQGRINAHGAVHINVFTEQTKLASVLYKLRRFKESHELFTSSLAGMENLVGTQSEKLLETLTGLALTCHAMHLLKEAETCYNRIYIFHCTVSGPAAEVSLSAGNKLAAIYKDESFFHLADQLCTEILTHATTTLGDQHTITQESIELLARIRMGEGKSEEAEEMYRRSLE
jgi:tetratricopeptide (TPR) repeat protein